MNPIIIPVHSFVDLITNSSSEIFVSATAKTVEAAEKVINHLLKSQGIEKTAKDLFKIRLQYSVRGYNGDTVEESFETEQARAEFMEKNEIEEYSEYTNLTNQLVIEPKKKSDPDLKGAAEALASFFDTCNTFEGQQ